MIVYVDTSALVKTIVEEDGSALADELWSRAHRRIASRLVYPEARAALAAAGRSGRLGEDAVRTAIADLDAACGALTLIGVDWLLARHAGELAERHALRGYDAVHLATALASGGPDLVLATWDRALGRAAARVGVAVVPGSAGR